MSVQKTKKTKKPKQKIDMFGVFSKSLTKKPASDEEMDEIVPFLYIKWLSGNKTATSVANIINIIPEMPKRTMFRLVSELLPPQISYINYPKGQKKEDRYIKLISNIYNINHSEAKLYYNMLTTDDLIELEESQQTGGLSR